MEAIIICCGFIFGCVLVFFIFALARYIKIYNRKSRLKKVYAQLKNQVEIKCDAITNYVVSNDKDVSKDLKMEFKNKSSDYYLIKNINDLKEYSSYCSSLVFRMSSDELKKMISDVEDKIDYVRSYYNELATSYNKYIDTGFNKFFVKCNFISFEELY